MSPPVLTVATPRRAWLRHGLAWAMAPLAMASHAGDPDPTGGDPLGSMQWPLLRQKFIGQAVVAFDPAVVVQGPAFAEDALNVPVQIDLRALSAQGLGIQRVVVVADRNPVQHILDFEPQRALPVLAFRFKLEQSSPVRALVQTTDGAWRVGHTWVNAAGGGCTVPGQSRNDGSWSRTLNQVQARWFRHVLSPESVRLRLRIMHPMDTGLVAGIPAFYLDELALRDANGEGWGRLWPHEPVAENPLFTLELPHPLPHPLWLQGRDNNGNRIEQELQP